MNVKPRIQQEILKILAAQGANGISIIEIEKHIKYERHTLSKYLSFMEAHGQIYHKTFGKAKVWFINRAPLKTILQSLPEKKTYIESILANIITNIPLGLIVIDKDYNILFQNKQALTWYGRKEGEKFYSAILGKENPLKIRKITQFILDNSETTETKVDDHRGNILRIHASKLRNPDDTVSYLLLLNDITQKIRVQENLQEQKMLLEAEREALNKSAIVAETDLTGKITYVNDKFVEISGYTKKELIGQTHKLINAGHHPPAFFKELWETISQGKIWQGVIKNKAKDGSFYWVESAIAPVLDKKNKPVKYLAIRFDITPFMK